MSSSPVVAAAAAGRVVEITGSRAAASLAQAAAVRYRDYGVTVKPTDLRVWQDEDGYVLVPVGTPTIMLSTTRPDGSVAVEIAPTTERMPPVTSPSTAMLASITPAAAPYWALVATQCFTRISDTWSWLDHCYQMYQEANDGSATRDYYALQHYATASNNSPWRVYWAQIRSYPASTSAPQTWVDWAPKGDTSGSCDPSYTIGISAPIVLTMTSNRCEIWHMTKSNPTVDYTLQWISSGVSGSRGLAYENSVSVGQGLWPVWVLPAEVHGGI